MSADWPGTIDTEALSEGFVEQTNLLADAAKAGNWAEVFSLLDSHDALTPNQWRVSGTSWFTPLHQAAWLGASAEIAEQLIRRGAWRALRDARGDRPIDIARKRDHHHLEDVLNVREPSPRELQKFAAWDHHLAALVAERTDRLAPVKIRPLPTELVAIEQLTELWFRYPGMYGGFGVSIHKNRLFVESWSRVVDGSGQAHVITEGGFV
ncbi:hypothetical protein JOF28_000076 [Leucobacter exalbidus]|uniref:Ankyrin repeat domain-containing protein n=1 Tax=Leucobacter exalbidus TaxID=662960 RepID=A0A940PNU1_9MICO|nr:ankyrin repeat domain-containing protein [Leucobacter exalbidus]MBP1324844.1 hypothetical protein [Leucobacter exalbidus]